MGCLVGVNMNLNTYQRKYTFTIPDSTFFDMLCLVADRGILVNYYSYIYSYVYSRVP